MRNDDRDDLSAARDIINAILLSIPLWLIILGFAWMLFH